MKALTHIILFFALVFMFSACQKSITGPIKLVPSSKTVMINQADTLQITGVDASNVAGWQVSPSGSNSFYNSGIYALLTFTKAGSYTVIATLKDGTTYACDIQVTNQVLDTHISLAGDQITLLANYYKSRVTDTTYLTFTGITTKKYVCSNSIINFTYNLDASNNFSINFIDVIPPTSGTCTTSNSSLFTPLIRFWQNQANPYMVPGTYPLTVTLSNVVYTGTITVTATDITINWPYTSGVMVTPVHFTR